LVEISAQKHNFNLLQCVLLRNQGLRPGSILTLSRLMPYAGAFRQSRINNYTLAIAREKANFKLLSLEFEPLHV